MLGARFGIEASKISAEEYGERLRIVRIGRLGVDEFGKTDSVLDVSCPHAIVLVVGVL